MCVYISAGVAGMVGLFAITGNTRPWSMDLEHQFQAMRNYTTVTFSSDFVGILELMVEPDPSLRLTVAELPRALKYGLEHRNQHAPC